MEIESETETEKEPEKERQSGALVHALWSHCLGTCAVEPLCVFAVVRYVHAMHILVEQEAHVSLRVASVVVGDVSHVPGCNPPHPQRVHTGVRNVGSEAACPTAERTAVFVPTGVRGVRGVRGRGGLCEEACHHGQEYRNSKYMHPPHRDWFTLLVAEGTELN